MVSIALLQAFWEAQAEAVIAGMTIVVLDSRNGLDLSCPLEQTCLQVFVCHLILVLRCERCLRLAGISS